MGQALGYNCQLVSDDPLLSFADWSRLVEVGSAFLADSFVNRIRNRDVSHLVFSSKATLTESLAIRLRQDVT